MTWSPLFRPTPHAFVARLTALLRAQEPSLDIVYDRDSFRLLLDSGTSIQHLDNHYRDFCACWPWHRRAQLDHTVAYITLMRAERPAPTWAEARPRLLPVIRSAIYLEQARLLAMKDGKAWNPGPNAPLADALLVLVMIDSDHDMAVLGGNELERWAISSDEAMAVAIQNLRRLDGSPCTRLGPGLLRSAWSDGYATSRILDPAFIAGLGFRGDPVALLPHRECLLLADADDDASLARMAEIGAAEFQKARFISEIPLVHRQGAWQPYTTTSTGPGARALALLCRDGRMHDYEEQRGVLDAVHALGDGSAPYVSQVRLISNHAAGTSHTCTSWTKGVPTLLPRCEFVGLVDMERSESECLLGIFRWVDLERACGPLLKPVGMIPERWLTGGFPDGEVLRGLERVEFWRTT